MEPVKISSLDLENVKRIKAVSLVPTQDGLTVIGGKNAQGKTSVIDAIAWALGGERLRPERPTREGSATPAKLSIELSNGLLVTRSGKNGTLKVVDPSGKKSGQSLLNDFVDELAINLPKFMSFTDKEKAEVLLDLIGVGDQLFELDRKLQMLEDERRPLQRDYLGREKVAQDMPFHADVPDEPVSASDLIQQQQEILAKNGENQKKREQVSTIEKELELLQQHMGVAKTRIEDLNNELSKAEEELTRIWDTMVSKQDDLAQAQKSAQELKDESTAEIEAALNDIEETNRKIRENEKRADLMAEADLLREQYKSYSEQIDAVRKERTALLEGARLPLEGLTVEDGLLKYKGAVWSEMSSAEQLRVATAIARARKPECGFVLVDKLEQMDSETLAEFGKWAQEEGLQVIGTRVSTGDECSIVIEDGYVKDADKHLSDASVRATKDAAAPALKEAMAKPESNAKTLNPELNPLNEVFQPGVF